MKIDMQVEPLVRAVFDAIVRRDGNALENALTAFSTPRLTQQGVELAVAVCTFVLLDIHEGKPSPAEINEVAADIADEEEWIGPKVDEVRRFLQALIDQVPLHTVLPVESVTVLPYLVAANLLATAAEPENGEWWFKYLDKVETAIEATADEQQSI